MALQSLESGVEEKQNNQVPFEPTKFVGDTYSYGANGYDKTLPWNNESYQKYIGAPVTVHSGDIIQKRSFIRSDDEIADDSSFGGGLNATINEWVDIGLDVNFIKEKKLCKGEYLLVYSFKRDKTTIVRGWNALQVSPKFLNKTKDQFFDNHGTHVIVGRIATVEINLLAKYSSNSSQNQQGMKDSNVKVKFLDILSKFGMEGLSANIRGKKLKSAKNKEMSCNTNHRMSGVDINSEYYDKVIQIFNTIASGSVEMNASGLSEAVRKLVCESDRKNAFQPKYFVVKPIECIGSVTDMFAGARSANHQQRRPEPPAIATLSATASASNKKPVRAPETAPASVQANGFPREYIVKARDTLSSIVKIEYGVNSWNKVVKLYDANKKVIGPNMNIIKPGQKLILPPL